MIRFFFNKKIWHAFGDTLMKYFFGDTSFRYDFGFGARDVRTVCKYYKDPYEQQVLQKILDDNKIVDKDGQDKYTVLNAMKWLLKTYPPSLLYSPDQRERWNKPSETIGSWEARKAYAEKEGIRWSVILRLRSVSKENLSTDCDDYAIFLYNLLRVAGVPAEKLWLTFMKTSGEWHMNLMFVEEGVPYAVEGTYYPDKAVEDFLRVPYFQNERNGDYYYRYVRYRWNEDKVQRYKARLNSMIR